MSDVLDVAEEEEEERAQGSGVIQSVVTAAQILEAMAAAAQPVRLTALAQQLGEPKAKIHRHLSTLKFLGFVDQDAQTECYKLAPKLALIGQVAADQLDLRRLAEPYMMRLRDLTRQTVVLSLPAAGGDSIANAVVESSDLVTISVRLGYRLPSYSSAQGRVTLAFSPPEVQQRVLSRKLAALTPHTIVDPGKLRERLARIRTQLYDVAMDETVLGISAVAAPIFDFSNKLVAAIGVVGTTQHVHEPVHPEQLQFLRACTKAISLKLNATAYEELKIPNLREFIFD
ncbi:MAG TPA: IclR family transcriptional regulator [Xanthobacteraceae bacterium]|jgi:IclR family acetate operon transcriptional repressor|nr:IclR family transcriptional regulator [Xanthobacteraceae bacterium]